MVLAAAALGCGGQSTKDKFCSARSDLTKHVNALTDNLGSLSLDEAKKSVDEIKGDLGDLVDARKALGAQQADDLKAATNALRDDLSAIDTTNVSKALDGARKAVDDYTARVKPIVSAADC